MKSIKQITQELKKTILSNSKNLALELFRDGLQQNEVDFIAQIRQDGVLRCSNYDFQSLTLNYLIKEANNIRASESTQSYLKSIKALLTLSRSIQKIFKILIDEVNFLEIKSYLVAVDSFFWSLDSSLREYNYDYSVSREDLASAFSLYLYYSHDRKTIGKSRLNEVNEKRLNEKYYYAKLKEFNKILFFKECEVLVDRFNYTVRQDGTRVIVTAPNEKFEMSLRLGYVRQLNQELAISLDSLLKLKTSSQSIYNFATQYYDEFKESIFRTIHKPLKRIVMELPKVKPLLDILGSKEIFLEEIIIVKQIEINFFVGLEEINSIAIYKSLSLFDIIKIQRVFTFIFSLFILNIEKNNLFKSKLFWRSILPVFSACKLKDFLANFLGTQKVEEMFELLRWQLKSNKIFDLQTYPFVDVEDWIVLPLGILANSNLYRNILQATGFRFDSESSEDPIVITMEKCLKSVASIIKTNLKYSFNGIKGDIDVLAVIDNHLFVFECKNSLHPCNPFELRTTYDYIQKAASQLTRFQNLWQQETFRNYLATKISTPHLLPSQLCSCIVTGNRMFSGLHIHGHNVRPVYELCNLIRTGSIVFNLYSPSNTDNLSETITIKLWREDKFSAGDLFSYIQEDSIHKYYFNSMQKTDRLIKLDNKILIQESYYLDADNFFQQLIYNFKFIKEQ